MDRRKFLNIGAGAVVAAGFGGLTASAKAADGLADSRVTDGTIPFKKLPGEYLHYQLGEETPGPLPVRFLGTGAAGKPSPDADGLIRRHSSVLLDKKVIIDFTPTSEDMIPEGFHPEALFYTHSHGDHYDPGAALKLAPERIFLSETWAERAMGEFETASKETGLPVPPVIPLGIGDKVTIAGMTLTALPACHATSDLKEQAMIYLIEKLPVRVLYATDTAGIPAIDSRLVGIDPHIKPGNPINGLIMESTMGIDGDEDFRIFCHSSAALVLRTVHMLLREGRYIPKEGQPVYLTHIARSLHGNQSQLQLDKSLPSPLKAAYDGLEVVFGAGNDGQ
jgi:hypothetical protein